MDAPNHPAAVPIETLIAEVRGLDRAAIDAWRDLQTAREMLTEARRKSVTMPRTPTAKPFVDLVARTEERFVAALNALLDLEGANETGSTPPDPGATQGV